MDAESRKLSEHQEQTMLLNICRLHTHMYPELALLHAIPNGGKRGKIAAGKLKAEGVKAGIPDLFLPAPRQDRHGLYIELKSRAGKISEAQDSMMAALFRQGYACKLCRGWEEAWEEIKRYLGPPAL